MVVDITGLSELAYIREDAGAVRIGALATLDMVSTSGAVRARMPIVAEAARWVGSQQIRNVATVAGNVCNASPSADMSPALIALGATARGVSAAGERERPFEEFFTGPGTTDLASDEMLVEVVVPVMASRSGAYYAKLPARTAIDLAVVGVAVYLVLSPDRERVVEARVVMGAVAPVPIRALEAEGILVGSALDDRVVSEVAEAASRAARPISDVRASADYRREMVGVLTSLAVREAAVRATA
jgi:carbon-monoxide dehydrogenase medium subunit